MSENYLGIMMRILLPNNYDDMMRILSPRWRRKVEIYRDTGVSKNQVV